MEELVMASINMSMKLGYLDIDIKIKKDKEKIAAKRAKKIENDLRIQKIMEEHRNIELKNNIYNIYY